MGQLLQGGNFGSFCHFFLKVEPQCDKPVEIVQFFFQLPVVCYMHTSHSQMLGKVKSGGGPIFKVVLEC